MRGYSKSISVFAVTVAAVLFFSLTTAFAAVQNIKGVEFEIGRASCRERVSVVV